MCGSRRCCIRPRLGLHSRHLEPVGADLHIRLVHFTAGVPQGRGKLELLFGPITTELLPRAAWMPPTSIEPASDAAAPVARQLDERVGRRRAKAKRRPSAALDQTATG